MKQRLQKQLDVYKVYLAVAKEQIKKNPESVILERISVYETVISDLAKILEEGKNESLVTEVAQEYITRQDKFTSN